MSYCNWFFLHHYYFLFLKFQIYFLQIQSCFVFPATAAKTNSACLRNYKAGLSWLLLSVSTHNNSIYPPVSKTSIPLSQLWAGIAVLTGNISAYMTLITHVWLDGHLFGFIHSLNLVSSENVMFQRQHDYFCSLIKGWLTCFWLHYKWITVTIPNLRLLVFWCNAFLLKEEEREWVRVRSCKDRT